MPMVRISPAMPGSVRAASEYAISPSNSSRFTTTDTMALIPERL